MNSKNNDNFKKYSKIEYLKKLNFIE
jgi:hypothetical protein